MFQTVQPPGSPGAGGMADSENRTGATHQQGRDARRKKVRSIVEACGYFAKPLIIFVSMANHRIKRIHSLVCHRHRNAPDHQICQRRDHSVAQAFGESLDNGACNFVRIKSGRVAPNNARKTHARSFEVRLFQCLQHGAGFVQQVSCGKAACYQPDLNDARA
jgi:hypothetical protein